MAAFFARAGIMMLAIFALGVVSGTPTFAAAPGLLPDLETEASPPASTPGANSIEIDREAGQDDRIAARLREIFANVPSLANITVSVREGVVTLAGSAADSAAEGRAQAIASGVEGVVTVENAIERDVSVDVGEQARGLQDRFAAFMRMLPLIGTALLTALAIGALGYLLASPAGMWRRIAPNSFLAELIASALRFVFVIGGIVVALDMLGAGALMGAVLGGAGVIGIALGFAMRDTIENYVASLMLSLRQPFRPNDWVVIDSKEGRVVRLTSRATVLMTLDGNHLRIPNSAVFKAVILNYTTNPQRRFEFTLGVDADDDVEAARQLGRETLAAMPFVLESPVPEVRVLDVGDSNVLLQFLGWIDQSQADWHRARSRAIVTMKTALEAAGFGLPEPIYRLRFDPRTTPLPLEDVARRAAPAQADKPAAPPAPEPAPDPALDEEDLIPQDEIARMVDEERAETPPDKDLLDPSRPVE